jgi:hypothetical protein
MGCDSLGQSSLLTFRVNYINLCDEVDYVIGFEG